MAQQIDHLTPLTHELSSDGWWQPRRDRTVPAAAKVTFPDWPGVRVVVFWRELVDERYRYFVNGEHVQPAEFRARWERECPGERCVWDFDDERERAE